MMSKQRSRAFSAGVFMILILLVGSIILSGRGRLTGQAFAATGVEPASVRAAGRITTVTAHRGWASVVRRVEVVMAAPEVVLQLTDLPAAAVHDSVQAEILDNGADSVTVREIQVGAPSATGQAEVRIVLTLNLEDEVRSALHSTVIVNVNYVVTNVDWVPAYTIRAHSESTTVRIACDVVIGQSTGEDWDDVLLTVSSAPGRVPRWDSIFRARKMGTAGKGERTKSTPAEPTIEEPTGRVVSPLVDFLGGDASVFGSQSETMIFDWSNSPIVEQTLPYRVSVSDGTLTEPQPNHPTEARAISNANSTVGGQSQRIRFRLDEFITRPPFRYVAVPAHSQNAFLVGSIRNDRPYYLLPGCVSLFLDSEYAGEMILPNFAPGERLDIAFGTEPNLLVHRREISRTKRKTGLLADGRETQINYQLSIQNNTGRAATVEVWDQIPVAEGDQITLSVDDLSDPLSKDRDYVAVQRPRGLLRWDLSVPATPRLNAPRTIDYALVISHHRDVTPAWIPR